MSSSQHQHRSRPTNNTTSTTSSHRNSKRKRNAPHQGPTAEEEDAKPQVPVNEQSSGVPYSLTPPDYSNANSSSSDMFNTADEFEDEASDSVVNASMVVNLSNANVTFSEDGGGGGGSVIGEQEQVGSVVAEAPLQQEQETDEELKTTAPTGSPHVDPPVDSNEDKGLSPSSSVVVPDGNGGASSSSSSASTQLADSEVADLMDLSGKLPGTVTRLVAANGVVVYVVGTAHFSEQSQEDVIKTIRLTRPTIVLLELCSSRKNILTLDEETVLREVSEMSFQKVRLALSNSGTVQGTLHLLLLSMSAQLTRKLGMAPGGEFRAAMREAKKIPGCVLLLGDRPFNITISRALAALSFFQKIKLAWQFLTCNEDITREEIEKCKEKDLLERMLTEMTGEFPSITEVFVNERDVYLAHSLHLAATSEAHKSNGGPVVGVVGMGHVPGIVRNWGATTDEAVGGIIRIPPTPLSTLILRKTLKLGVYAACAYGVYRVGLRVASAGASRNPFSNGPSPSQVGRSLVSGFVRIGDAVRGTA